MVRAISRKTYIQFMKKYQLKLMEKIGSKYKYKPMKIMSEEIYDHESKHDDIVDGLYYSTY